MFPWSQKPQIENLKSKHRFMFSRLETHVNRFLSTMLLIQS
jgi:hypothetical protein